jgi:hypothetical protein
MVLVQKAKLVMLMLKEFILRMAQVGRFQQRV